MPADYEVADLPAESVTVNGRTWEREKFDTDSYQWVRPMRDDEYDWDPEEDDVSLVGTDVPIRVVELQYRNGEWHVSASETAGPNYHRPGYTELIRSEFSESTTDFDEATETIRDFINRLS